jgi:hypothetical protein
MEAPLGWDLLSYSWEELKANKRLLIFPILSATTVVALFVALYYAPAMPHRWRLDHFGPVRLLLFYCAFAFVSNFFNCALAACAQIRFSGGQPTAADGLRRAAQRLPAILLWSLAAASVGVLLNQLEQRLSILGKLLVKLVGFAWGVATYLVVPILVIEEESVSRTIRKSAGLLRKTWGEQLSVGIGLGVIILLYLLPGVALMIIGYQYSPVLVAAGAAAIAAVLVGQEALVVMFQVALYRYATGNAVAVYPADVLRDALRRQEN